MSRTDHSRETSTVIGETVFHEGGPEAVDVEVRTITETTEHIRIKPTGPGGARLQRFSSRPKLNEGDEVPEDTSDAYLSGFRPPSPTNVIQLLDRTVVAEEGVVVSLTASLDRVPGEAVKDTATPTPVTPSTTVSASVGVRAKKLGAMRQSDAQMVDSVLPKRSSDASCADRPSLPFIVPTLFKHFHFYQAKDQDVPDSVARQKSLTKEDLSKQSSVTQHKGRSRSAGGAAPQESPMSDSSEMSISGSSSNLMSPTSENYEVMNQNSVSSSNTSRNAYGRDTPSSSQQGNTSSQLMHTVVNKDLFNLTAGEHSLLLRDLIYEYVSIYFENPHSFHPFYKKRKPTMSRAEQAKMIYNHMKHETNEKPLQQLFHKLKPNICAHVEFILGEKSLRVAKLIPTFVNQTTENNGSNTPSRNSTSASGTSTPKNGGQPTVGASCLSMINMMTATHDEFRAEVNRVVENLRQECMRIFARINERCAAVIFPNYAEIRDYEAMNEAVLNILFEPEINEAIRAYHLAYQHAAATFPGRILLSTLFRNRIESRSYHDEISVTDQVMAVEEFTSLLRNTIHGFMRTHPDLVTALFQTPAEKVISSSTPGIAPTSEIVRLATVYRNAAIDWLHASRIYTKLFTPATTWLVRRLKVTDAVVFRLISENKFQEALWHLLDIGADRQGNMLEDWMTKYILQSEFITEARTLGGGFTTTKIVTLQPDDMEIPGIMSHVSVIYGVFKPKPKVSLFSLQSLKDSIVSNHRKEVAAYRIDRMLHLHHVPLTKSILYEEHEGSIQYFVPDTVSARDLNTIDMQRPMRSGKFGKATSEQSRLTRSINLFDWLIDNRDRNLDNYLVSTVDQRHILIDHSWTYNTPTLVETHDRAELMKLVPNQVMYQRCVALSRQPDYIEAQLKNLLSKSNIDAFKSRLNVMVKFCEGEIAKVGEAEFFRVPNAEDRRIFSFDDELLESPHPVASPASAAAAVSASPPTVR